MEAYCVLFLAFLMIGCFVRTPVYARTYKEGITHDKGLTIIRSSGPLHRGRPASTFTHVDAGDKYTNKIKHGPLEHVFDGSDKHDGRSRDARTRLRDFDKYQGYESVQVEPLEDFTDMPDSRKTRTRLMNEGKTIVFTGDEGRHPVQDVMNPEKSRVHEGKATVFSGDNKGDKGSNHDPRKPPETLHTDEVQSNNMQAGRQPEHGERLDDQDDKLSRKKRSNDEAPSLERVKRLTDDELSLQRMKRWDDDDPTLQRMKRLYDDDPTLQLLNRFDDDEPSLQRMKRLDKDEDSQTREQRVLGKPKIFEGLPIEPHVSRFDDDMEAMSRMRRLQAEKLSKYDEELSRMKQHNDDEPPVRRYKSND